MRTDYGDLLSFREIDTRHGLTKGGAFRAFKALGERLIEGEHFIYLDAAGHAAEIESLRQAGRLYPTTVNAVLLTASGYGLLRERL